MAAPVTPLVLAVLADGDSYGYAILKGVREPPRSELAWATPWSNRCFPGGCGSAI